MKKTLFMLMLVLLMGMSGCAASGVNAAIDSTPDIPGIIAKQAAAMQEVNSCQANVYLETDFKSATSSKESISITADMKSTIDVTKHLLSSVISTNFTVSGSRKEMTQEIIAAGDNVFFKDSEQGQWQRKMLDEAAAANLWNEQESQLTGARYSELLSTEGFTYTGKETVNGHSCYALKQSLDTQDILELSPELVEQMQSAQGVTDEDLEKMAMNAELVCLIDAQTYHLRELRITARIDQLVQGQQVTGDIKQICRFDAFNEPVSIQVPEVK